MRKLINNKGSATIIIVVVLCIIYFLMFSFSFRGWGYMGYRGFHYGPSWWYWGGPRYYYGTSIRHDSWGSRSHRGGGIRGGK